MDNNHNKKKSDYSRSKKFYYIRSYFRKIVPAFFYRMNREKMLSAINLRSDADYIKSRVDYYNKLSENKVLPVDAMTISQLSKSDNENSRYYFDTREYTRWFPTDKKLLCEWGVVTYVPSSPSIVKSRPIDCDNECSILMNLDKIKHFVFVDDDLSWQEKKNLVIFNGNVLGMPKRELLFEKLFGNKLCVLGETNPKGNAQWVAPKLSIQQQLKYKFILSIEGEDVASSLKWIMSSGSIAVMPKPEYETWFMEGKLKAGVHYIEVKPDYSDLEERINYYLNHEDKCLNIINNANDFVSQFQDSEREKYISLLVLDKYFKNTCL